MKRLRFRFSNYTLFTIFATDYMLIAIIEILLRGFAVGLAASITVGPVAVLCIQRTLSKTTRAGMMSGLGVACADTLMAVIAYFFFAMMQAQIERYSHILSSVGGVFVVVVGIYIFFQNPVPQIRKNKTGQSVLWQDFGSMFGFTLANFIVVIPYILAFFTMFNIDLTIDFSGADGAVQFIDSIYNILVLGGFFLGATLWWLAVTSIISIFHKGFKPRHMIIINRVAGLVIMVLGIATLLSVIIE